MENQAQMETPNVGGDTAQPSHPELTITDLQNLRAVVEVAVRRGVFAASELTSIGAVYDKLNAFLTAVAPKAEEKK